MDDRQLDVMIEACGKLREVLVQVEVGLQEGIDASATLILGLQTLLIAFAQLDSPVAII